jgi:hypothetical protein
MAQALLLSLRQTYFCNQSFLCRCAINVILYMHTILIRDKPKVIE